MAAKIGLGLLFVLALAGCREEEHDRALKTEKGTYAGAAMPVLDEETRTDLKNRAQHQNF